MHIIEKVLEVIGYSIVAVIVLGAIAVGIFGALVSATWGRKQ